MTDSLEMCGNVQNSLTFVRSSLCLVFFFFNDTATTEIYTLSLHDALPIWQRPERRDHCRRPGTTDQPALDRKSTRLNSSHDQISYAVFCLKKKKQRYNAEHNKNTHPYDRYQRENLLVV